MSYEAKALLKKHIFDFLDELFESDFYENNEYIYDDLVEDIADAAFAVLSANKKGQAYLRELEGMD